MRRALSLLVILAACDPTASSPADARRPGLTRTAVTPGPPTTTVTPSAVVPDAAVLGAPATRPTPVDVASVAPVTTPPVASPAPVPDDQVLRAKLNEYIWCLNHIDLGVSTAEAQYRRWSKAAHARIPNIVHVGSDISECRASIAKGLELPDADRVDAKARDFDAALVALQPLADELADQLQAGAPTGADRGASSPSSGGAVDLRTKLGAAYKAYHRTLNAFEAEVQREDGALIKREIAAAKAAHDESPGAHVRALMAAARAPLDVMQTKDWTPAQVTKAIQRFRSERRAFERFVRGHPMARDLHHELELYDSDLHELEEDFQMGWTSSIPTTYGMVATGYNSLVTEMSGAFDPP